MASEALIEVQHLKKYFPVTAGVFQRKVADVKAVDDVSFQILRGETFGLVGESGCGKTSVGKTILRLHEPTSGKILYDGKDLCALSKQQMREERRSLQIIYQDPNASLDPRMTVGELIREPLDIFGVGNHSSRQQRVRELVEMVGLAEAHISRYPHEFSGGQRQRIGIARALALNPKFVVCDEPVSALDVSIQSQIINLLGDLQKELGLTYLFIAHGLAVVKHFSSRVGVMYLGKMVELAGVDDIYDMPLHPYTKALMAAIPVPSPVRTEKKYILEGDVPSPISPPSGCRFHTRCKYAKERCMKEEPELCEKAPGHFVACHYALELREDTDGDAVRELPPA